MTMWLWETLEKMDEYENIIFAIQSSSEFPH